MNLFTAAVYTNNYMKGQRHYPQLTEHEQAITRDLPNILESYHYVGKQRFVDEMRADGAKIFLDSGAFSAYTLGFKIDLPTYCDYIKRNLDIIRVEDGVVMASVLDGIGDPLETYNNQHAMEWHGVKPLPCFHAGEPDEYLDHYVKNYEYITLGGMVGASTKQLEMWLDHVWDKYLTDGSGNAKIKVHGFGITSIPLMERYPWYSCDSSSWIQATSFGAIVTPEYGPLNISSKSPSAKMDGQHIFSLTPIEYEQVKAAIEARGFDMHRLSEEYVSRAAYNLLAYKTIGDSIDSKGPIQFKSERVGLFDDM